MSIYITSLNLYMTIFWNVNEQMVESFKQTIDMIEKDLKENYELKRHP